MECWNDGVLECGVMECWSIGVLECWSNGVLECWNDGVLECWSSHRMSLLLDLSDKLHFLPTIRILIR